MIHLLPLLLAKVAGKFALKKVAGHHAVHQSLGRTIVKDGAQKAANAAVDRVTAPKDTKGETKS